MDSSLYLTPSSPYFKIKYNKRCKNEVTACKFLAPKKTALLNPRFWSQPLPVISSVFSKRQDPSVGDQPAGSRNWGARWELKKKQSAAQILSDSVALKNLAHNVLCKYTWREEKYKACRYKEASSWTTHMVRAFCGWDCEQRAETQSAYSRNGKRALHWVSHTQSFSRRIFTEQIPCTWNCARASIVNGRASFWTS